VAQRANDAAPCRARRFQRGLFQAKGNSSFHGWSNKVSACWVLRADCLSASAAQLSRGRAQEIPLGSSQRTKCERAVQRRRVRCSNRAMRSSRD
jgi:hypothetical protein